MFDGERYDRVVVGERLIEVYRGDKVLRRFKLLKNQNTEYIDGCT